MHKLDFRSKKDFIKSKYDEAKRQGTKGHFPKS